METQGRIALCLPPNSPEEFLHAVLEDLKVSIKTKTKQMLKARGFLLSSISRGKAVIIVVDEAQNLSMRPEERLLSNLETEREKLLRMV